MPTNASLDTEAIRVLQRLGGAAFVRQLIETFLRVAPKRIQQSHDALRAGNWLDLERFALALRSSAGNIGAAELRDLARILEDEAGRHNVARVPSLLVRLDDALARFRKRAEDILRSPETGAA